MKKKISIAVLFILNIVSLHALATGPGTPGGEEPCPPEAGPDGCPLDTWVILLAAAALIFTIIYLHRKQKAADLAA